MSAAHPLDPVLSIIDRALRAVFAPASAGRPLPSSAPDTPLSETDRQRAAALMRVNHAGEVAAQALYHGQALAARTRGTRELLLAAAQEESDHLAWCEARLAELHSHPSRLNPLWYAGSFAIGAAAGLLGDRTSLGFVSETENQVERHLDSHLERLPQHDRRSREIVAAMRADETRHGATARSAGAEELPSFARALMRQTARIMTHTAYWI